VKKQAAAQLVTSQEVIFTPMDGCANQWLAAQSVAAQSQLIAEGMLHG